MQVHFSTDAPILQRIGRYMTTTAVAFFACPMESSQQVSARAILPYVLMSGTRLHPVKSEWEAYVRQRVGTPLQADVYKQGGRQWLLIALRAPNLWEKDSSTRIQQMFEVMEEVWNEPLVVEGAFALPYVEQQKSVHVQRLALLEQDPFASAKSALENLLFTDHSFKLSPYGKLEDVLAMTPERLYAEYMALRQARQLMMASTGQETSSKRPVSPLTPPLLPQVLLFDRTLQEEREHPAHQSVVSVAFVVRGKREEAETPALLLAVEWIRHDVKQKLRERGASYSWRISFDETTGVLILQAGTTRAQAAEVAELLEQSVATLATSPIQDTKWKKVRGSLFFSWGRKIDDPLETLLFACSQHLDGKNSHLEKRLHELQSVTQEEMIHSLRRFALAARLVQWGGALQ